MIEHWTKRLIAIALAAVTLGSGPVQARVGESVAAFEAGPMVKSGEVAFLEPFSLRNNKLRGVTYRATDAYQKACQIMLVVKGGVITSEIFAMPVIEDRDVIKAEKTLLDSFLEQSGIPKNLHSQVREQLLGASDRPVAPRQLGGYSVQYLLIPAEIPLLVLAVAKDETALPLPKPTIQPQIQE